MPTLANAKEGWTIEQLNIVGRRSGEGFVAHKAVLVNALSRALANAVVLMGLTIERRGLLGYLKALGGSNVIKVTPCASSASGSQATSRRLKVICGANTAYLQDMAWVREKVPLTLCEVRVSPNNSVKPNIGSLELAEALNRVLPFTAKDDTRPVLSCINFTSKDGKLTLVSADGFRLAVVSLDYDDGEGQALISRNELGGISQALKRTKRARISFEPSGTSLDGINLILDTELIRYKWTGYSGSYPEWQKLIPTEFNTFAHFDAIEAIKAIASLKVLADSKSYPIDLAIGDGKIVMANPDDKGQAEVSCDTDGEVVRIRIDGSYLSQALRACGGMVDFKLTNAYLPTLFSTDGYQLVVMPMMTTEAGEQAKKDRESKPEEAKAEAKAETEDTATEQAEVITKNKPKRSRKREAVAVA